MVGSVIDVGLDRYSYEGIKWLLENPSLLHFDPHLTLAPAKGLAKSYLIHDNYNIDSQVNNLDFIYRK
jgi:hypothetical protein